MTLIPSRDQIRIGLNAQLGGQWAVGEAQLRTHSTIYIAHGGESSRERVVVKVPSGSLFPTLDIPALERERDGLVLAREIFGENNPQFGVPKVRAFSELGWIALEFIDGDTFAARLASAEHIDQPKLMRSLGSWLGALHRGTGYDENDTLNTDAYLTRLVDNPVDSLPSEVGKALARLRAAPDFSGTVTMPSALAHGDAKLENFIIDSTGKIWGIDIQLNERGSVSFDLSGILNRFEIWTSSRQGHHLKAVRDTLSESFLEGYGWPEGHPLRSTLHRLRLAAVCGLIDDCVTQKRDGSGSVVRRFVDLSRYRKLARALLKADSEPRDKPVTGARRGLMFLFAESNFALVTQLLGMAIVARVLTPEQNGTAQVGVAIAAIASTFRDFGVAEYLIQKTRVDRDDFRRAFTVNVITSWSMFLLMAMSSTVVARFYGNDELVAIMLVLSLNFLLIPFGAVTMAWHRRKMNFEPLFWSGVVSNIVTFVVCIACVFSGLGALSLAWCSLAGVVATVAVAMYFRDHQTQHKLLFKGLAETFKFGKHVVGIYVIGQLGKSAPELIIGRMLSLSSVAFFSRGGSLLEIFSRLVTRVVAPVCLPYFTSALRDEGKLTSPYIRSVSYMTYIGWPFLLFAGFYSAEIIRVLFGSQWSDATFVAKLICIAGAIELTHVYAKEALIAVGRPDRGNLLQLANQLTRALAVVIGAYYGLVGVGVGLICAAAIGVAQSQYEVRKYAEIHLADVWPPLRQALGMLALMTLVLVGGHLLVSRFVTLVVAQGVTQLGGTNAVVEVLIAQFVTAFLVGVVFVAAFAAIATAQRHPFSQDFLAVVRRFRRRRKVS